MELLNPTWACLVCGTQTRDAACANCACPSQVLGPELAERQEAYRRGTRYSADRPKVDESNTLPLQALPRFWFFRWIVKHWQGGYSLGVSYWLNPWPRAVVLLALPKLLATRPIVVHHLDIWGIVLLEVLVPTYAWTGVGIWRSARRHIDTTGRRFWARLAQGMVLLGALEAANIFFGNVQLLVQRVAMYRTLDKLPPLMINVDSTGATLYVTGALTRGAGDKIAAAIGAHPKLRVVQFAGPGGLLDEARIAGAAVRQNHLTTFVSGECDSACTLMFMSGAKRVLYRAAVLGFHSPLMAPVTVANLFAYSAAMRKELIELGATPDFAALASSVNSEALWRPSVYVLFSNHVATRVVDVRDGREIVDWTE
jgi:hypothetical protein